MKSFTSDSLSQQIERLSKALRDTDTVLIGAGAGLSTAAGLTYSGERFQKHFADFAAKYGIRDMYSGGFYPFPSPEEYWAWWSRHILVNRYDVPAGKPYLIDANFRDSLCTYICTNIELVRRQMRILYRQRRKLHESVF